MKKIRALFAIIVSVLFLSSAVQAGGHGGVELKFGHVGKPLTNLEIIFG